MSDDLDLARFERLADELRQRILEDLAGRGLGIYSVDGLDEVDVERWRRAARKIEGRSSPLSTSSPSRWATPSSFCRGGRSHGPPR